MITNFSKFTRTLGLVLTAGALTASVASAQVRIPPRDDKPIVINRNPPTAPITIDRPAGGQQAWPAAVAAVAAAVAACTEIVHRVTESWHPGVGLPQRGGLVQAGAYDR